MILTEAAVLALAMSCQSAVAPVTILKIAQTESGLNPDATHRNRDGTTDYGLMQINERNFRLLGLTKESSFIPCLSIAAEARLLELFSQNNTGSRSRGMDYAMKVQGVSVPVPTPPPKVMVRFNPFALPVKTPGDLVFHVEKNRQ